MKLIETLPYYLVQVRFQDNEIQIYDMISKKVVALEPLSRKIVALRKVKGQVYLELNEKDEIVSEISISIKLISKKSVLQTEAGYILDFHMLSQSHGFYFGYYEMGEFKLTKYARLVKIRSYPVHHCTKGRVNKSNDVYLGCRENDKYFLVKLGWKSDKDPNILWKKDIPSAVMVMEIIGDRLFIGLKNGSLQLWDIQKDECIKNIKLFSSTFSVSTVKGENIILASRDGDVARISKNGEIQWKTKITNEKIVGIYEDKDYILIINTIGEQFHIKSNSGILINHKYNSLELGGNAGLSSSIIKYRDRLVITGYGGIWAFRHRNFNNSIHQSMGGPLMRIIQQHPFGFFSGDDNESVCFWSLGDIKIKVENYKPPLKNCKKYNKLKSKSLSSLREIIGQADSYSKSNFTSKKKKTNKHPKILSKPPLPSDKLMKTAKLRIKRLEPSRSGRSLCYVDQSIMESLGIATGDIIEINGRKRTAGIVVASFADRGKEIIRIDEIQRLNLGSTIGEFVTVRYVNAEPAKEIELAPTKDIYDIKKQVDAIKGKLIDKPIMAGDVIDIPETFTKIYENNNSMNSSRRPTLVPLRLKVLNITPKDEVVRFTRDTRIVLHRLLKSESKISSPSPLKPPGAPVIAPQAQLYDDTMKMIVFGEESVDKYKTSLIQRFLTNSFVSDQTMTIGVDFEVKSLSIDGQKVKLQIWDFGGGERFRFLLPTYARGARGGLFVYDITNYSSFAHIDDWLSIIRKEDRAKIPILLVGILSNEKNKRQVSAEKGKEIAKSKNLNGFIECNLKTGKNVEKAFEALTRLMVANKGYNFVIAKKRDDRFSLKSKERTKISSPKMRELKYLLQKYTLSHH